MEPQVNMVAQWVKDAWKSIPLETIEKSFRKYISNVPDGSEDNATFADDRMEADKESESEDDIAYIYDDNAGAAMTEAEFNELYGELQTDSEFEGF